MAAGASNLGLEEEAWATEEEDGAQEDGAMSGAPPTSRGPEVELLSIMRNFLEGQQRREEGLLEELRGLRASLPLRGQERAEPPEPRSPPVLAPPGSAASSSTWTALSSRVELPTPAPRQRSRPSQQERMPSRDSVYMNLQDQRYGSAVIPRSHSIKPERILRTIYCVLSASLRLGRGQKASGLAD